MQTCRWVVVRVVAVGLCSLLLWSPVAADAKPAGPVTPIGRATEAKLQLGGDNDWLTSDGSAVWVQDFAKVRRIDPTTNTVTASVEVKDEICQGLGFGDGSIWSCGGGGIVRVDPVTATVVSTIPLDKSADQGHLPVVAGRVWVITGVDAATLVGVNTATGTIDTTIPLDARCSETAAGFDAIWIACRSGSLLRVDPVAGTVTARFDDVPLAISVATNSASVFVGYERGVARIDPRTNTITARTKAPAGLTIGLSADDEHVWVRAPKPYPFLRKVDVRSMKIVERITTKIDSGGDVLVAFGSVWTTAYDDAFLFRLRP